MSNIWHDFNSERINENIFYTYIEIPKGSKNKYELDKESGILVLDRVLGASVQYPANYGFIPKTLAEDEDPLDVLLLCQEQVVPGCIVEAKPIGIMLMNDGGVVDEKIIAVATKDLVYSSYDSLDELPEHIIMEIKHFFEVYKAFEDKETVIKGFKNKEHAKRAINKAIQRYNDTFVGGKIEK